MGSNIELAEYVKILMKIVNREELQLNDYYEPINLWHVLDLNRDYYTIIANLR